MSPSEKEFKFKKLQGADNYKQWNRDMTFALQDARLWDHVMGSARRPPELIEKSDDSEERKERIYQRWKEIRDFDLDVLKTTAKISRMCNDTVQKEFLAVKNPTEWNSKDLWDWLKQHYTLQNFASKWKALDKLHAIRHSNCKTVSEYMGQIKDISAEIEELKISITEAIVIHALNNLDSHFQPYLAILRHDARQKEVIPTLSELTKTLEDEQQMRFSNENKGLAYYAHSSKSKKAKPSEQRGTREIGKRFGNGEEKKREKVKICKTCGGKYQKDCWHFKTECFICRKVGHIAAKCPEKSSYTSCASSTKKKFCYTQKITDHPDSKSKVG